MSKTTFQERQIKRKLSHKNRTSYCKRNILKFVANFRWIGQSIVRHQRGSKPKEQIKNLTTLITSPNRDTFQRHVIAHNFYAGTSKGNVIHLMLIQFIDLSFQNLIRHSATRTAIPALKSRHFVTARIIA